MHGSYLQITIVLKFRNKRWKTQFVQNKFNIYENITTTSDLKKLLILKKGIGIEKASDEKSM